MIAQFVDAHSVAQALKHKMIRSLSGHRISKDHHACIFFKSFSVPDPHIVSSCMKRLYLCQCTMPSKPMACGYCATNLSSPPWLSQPQPPSSATAAVCVCACVCVCVRLCVTTHGLCWPRIKGLRLTQTLFPTT